MKKLTCEIITATYNVSQDGQYVLELLLFWRLHQLLGTYKHGVCVKGMNALHCCRAFIVVLEASALTHTSQRLKHVLYFTSTSYVLNHLALHDERHCFSHCPFKISTQVELAFELAQGTLTDPVQSRPPALLCYLVELAYDVLNLNDITSCKYLARDGVSQVELDLNRISWHELCSLCFGMWLANTLAPGMAKMMFQYGQIYLVTALVLRHARI